MQKVNKDFIESKLSEHLEKLRNQFEEYQISLISRMGQVFTQQQEKVTTIKQDVQEYLNKLDNDENNLTSIESNEDDIIVFMY